MACAKTRATCAPAAIASHPRRGSARTEFPAQGFAGGGAGALRVYEVNGVVVNPKARIELAPGDQITMREAGGGGYGEA